ncbi:PREDICTED: F-box/LRR-repeat [Prunus dulcis]|uniref:PREDICTED: F-box/LRR-repeat n=1 Tax=Prunus dulcis TaxID=3755 RepID=A0A5E4EB71_PRUDU|nr:hypothetical protein L3X38_035828 [Prunus dulcis]VVA13023.1 PREDICTED: F-box/LRR-repeat [Prunus dulcis]
MIRQIHNMENPFPDVTKETVQDKGQLIYYYDYTEEEDAKRRKTTTKGGGKKHNWMISIDRISRLPDEILVSILSLLSLKEAAITSLLSKRWQHLWASTDTLDFDSKLDVGNNVRFFRRLTPELRHKKSLRYVDWVSRVMEQHKGPNMKRFRACFYLDRRFTTSIDRWIQIAKTKGVEILELELGDGVIDKGHYAFPYKVLGLEKGPNCFGHNIIGFKSLKVVNFKHVDVAEEILEYLLSNCPGLEQLTVYASSNLASLRVVGSSSAALKYLAIKHCCCLESIQIREVANLVSFTYHGGSVRLLLSDVPLLTEVYIEEADWGTVDSIRVVLPQLSCCILSQLEILMLDITPMTLDDDDFGPLQNHAFPILANLKHLELIVEADYCWSLHHLSSFMKVSPYLQRLVLKMKFVTWRRPKIKTAAKCPHPYLRVVEIVGYRGRACAAKHVMYLMKNAVSLEKIVIDPVLNHSTDKRVEEVKEEVFAKYHAMQHIKNKVPSTIEFVCI